MARRERRDNQQDKDRNLDRVEIESDELERESIAALKTILTKAASIVRPLGLTPEEACALVQEMYERVLDLDSRLVGESEENRKRVLTAYIAHAEVRREDDRIVVEYPATPAQESAASPEAAEDTVLPDLVAPDTETALAEPPASEES